MLRTLGISALFVLPALSASASQPYVEFSGISGNAGTISISRVPILLPNGQVIYKDLTLLLQANATGVLSSSIPIQMTSLPLPAQPLQSGIYVDVANAAYGFEMTGAGQLPNGVGKWIIRLATGINADCGIPATIYTGPLNASPLAARLSAAKITSSEYSYGVIDNGGGGYCGALSWYPNYLIGVSQVGNQVEFALFTYSGSDHNIAGARVDFVLSKKI
jgi:hypothetical protein